MGTATMLSSLTPEARRISELIQKINNENGQLIHLCNTRDSIMNSESSGEAVKFYVTAQTPHTTHNVILAGVEEEQGRSHFFHMLDSLIKKKHELIMRLSRELAQTE